MSDDADATIFDLRPVGYSECVALNTFSGLAAGALASLGNPLVTVVGGLAGLVIGSKVCRTSADNNPLTFTKDLLSQGDRSDGDLPERRSDGGFPDYLTRQEFAAFRGSLRQYGVVRWDDARFLATVAAEWVRRGGASSACPSDPEMTVGIVALLRQRPTA
jgi:hypothetical protein